MLIHSISIIYAKLFNIIINHNSCNTLILTWILGLVLKQLRLLHGRIGDSTTSVNSLSPQMSELVEDAIASWCGDIVGQFWLIRNELQKFDQLKFEFLSFNTFDKLWYFGNELFKQGPIAIQLLHFLEGIQKNESLFVVYWTNSFCLLCGGCVCYNYNYPRWYSSLGVTSWGSSTNNYVNTRVLSQCLLLPTHTIWNENWSTRMLAHVL